MWKLYWPNDWLYGLTYGSPMSSSLLIAAFQFILEDPTQWWTELLLEQDPLVMHISCPLPKLRSHVRNWRWTGERGVIGTFHLLYSGLWAIIMPSRKSVPKNYARTMLGKLVSGADINSYTMSSSPQSYKKCLTTELLSLHFCKRHLLAAAVYGCLLYTSQLKSLHSKVWKSWRL